MFLVTKDARCNFKKIVHSGTNELHAEGKQTSIFANREHKIIANPENWKEAINQVRGESLMSSFCDVYKRDKVGVFTFKCSKPHSTFRWKLSKVRLRILTIMSRFR